MKKAPWTIQLLYSSAIAWNLGCSSAKPESPVRRTQTATQPVSGDASQSQEDSKAESEAAAKPTPTPAPEVENKPATMPTPAAQPPAPFALTSAFANMAPIPPTYAQKNGSNQSPPLQWKNVPPGTGSFAIQMVDLNFQNPPFIHWTIYNIPAASTQIPAALPGGNNLAAPAEVLGASQTKAYAGPNPPNLHRYEWTIYAIKQGETVNLGTNSATNKTELESKSLGRATLIGTYQ